jgi:hypothetical protein
VPVNSVRILAGARRARFRHLQHEAAAGIVLAQLEPERRGGLVQSAGQGAGERRRHGAAVPFDRNERPAEARRQHARLNCRFESVIVGGDQPRGIARRDVKFFRDRLAWSPDLHRPIVDRTGDAPHAGRRVAGVTPRPDL